MFTTSVCHFQVLFADGPGQYSAAVCKQNNQVQSANPVTLQEQFTVLCKFEAFMASTDQAVAFWF